MTAVNVNVQANQITIFRQIRRDMRNKKEKKRYKKAQEMLIKADKMLEKSDPLVRRFLRIHTRAKNMIFKPAVKLLARILKKDMVLTFEDIPPVPWNNYQRIFWLSAQEGLEDMWKMMLYWQGDTSNIFNSPDAYYKHIQEKEFRGHKLGNWNRKMMINFLVTEALEDTADREWLNRYMLRQWHMMAKLHRVSEEERKKVPTPSSYPIYYAPFQFNPAYFDKMFKTYPVFVPSAPERSYEQGMEWRNSLVRKIDGVVDLEYKETEVDNLHAVFYALRERLWRLKNGKEEEKSGEEPDKNAVPKVQENLPNTGSAGGIENVKENN